MARRSFRWKCRSKTGTHGIHPGVLTPAGDGEFVLESAEPVQGIAPGQFAVIYDKNHTVCIGSESSRCPVIP